MVVPKQRKVCAQAGANSAGKSLINEEKVAGTHRKETHGLGRASYTQPRRTNTRVTVPYKAGKLSDSHSVGTAGSSKSREDQVLRIRSQIN